MATYCDEQKIDNQPGHYYVSVIDGPRHGFLLGPFDHHLSALLRVPAVKKEALKIDSRAAFYGFGTARIDCCDDPPQGRLNDLFQEKLDA